MTTNNSYRPHDSNNSKDQSLSPNSYNDLECQLESGNRCDLKANTFTIDFFAKLPTEILPNIFTRLSFEDLSNIKSVSRKWKNQVVTCPEAWSTFKISKNTLKEFEPHISNIEPYVKKLKLDGLSGDECQNVLTRRIHDGRFKTLHIINIKSYELFTRQKEDQVIQFMIALQQIKDTITELSIYVTTTDEQHPALPVETIIHTCTRLTKFHCIQYAAILKQQQLHEENETDDRPNLTDLNLGFKSFNQSILNSIISRCLNLKYLEFYGCKIRNNLELLQQLPPSIVNISENGEYYRLQRRKTSISVNRDNDHVDLSLFSSTGPGKITALFGVAETLQDLELVIGNSSIEDLRHFDLQLRFMPSSLPTSGSPIFSTTFHKLQSLVLYYNNNHRSTYNAFSINILQHSPALSSLSIYDCDTLPRELVNMIRQQATHSLTELSMDCVFDAEDQQSIEDLFCDLAIVSQQHQQLNNYGGIQKLCLSNCGFNMDKIMDSIASIDTLEHLDMQCCEMSADVMENYFEKLVVRHQRPSKLTKIAMTCQDGVTDKALEYINMLPDLKDISFWNQDVITETGIRPLKNNPQFERVYTCECELI
ncbi:hypothetical protein BDC45DRAFT_609924 [Circinella umbellata]|nr:hypothetical protein BDC45DRAFT_609924 [Circinella umbellata]